jgi:hypothetical protein
MVKMLSGYRRAVGRSEIGRRPLRIEGTARYVPSATVVALRYHVDVLARRPKLGKLAASIPP